MSHRIWNRQAWGHYPKLPLLIGQMHSEVLSPRSIDHGEPLFGTGFLMSIHFLGRGSHSSMAFVAAEALLKSTGKRSARKSSWRMPS